MCSSGLHTVVGPAHATTWQTVARQRLTDFPLPGSTQNSELGTRNSGRYHQFCRHPPNPKARIEPPPDLRRESVKSGTFQRSSGNTRVTCCPTDTARKLPRGQGGPVGRHQFQPRHEGRNMRYLADNRASFRSGSGDGVGGGSRRIRRVAISQPASELMGRYQRVIGFGFVLCAGWWAAFANTYYFPASAGFAEFPASSELTRTLFLKNLGLACVAALISIGMFLFLVRLNTCSASMAGLLSLSAGLLVLSYGWNQIARVIWGTPLQTAITWWHVLVTSGTMGAVGVGLFRKQPEVRRRRFFAWGILAPAWLQPDLSYDRLQLAVVTLILAFLASRLRLRPRQPPHMSRYPSGEGSDRAYLGHG